jgi:hypothetical protein
MNISRWTLRSTLALAVLALGTLRLAAQTTTGSIGGRITTANGQGLGDAQIQITNTETGMNVGSKSRADGNYVVPGLETGERYRVVVRRIGFAPQTVQPVRVTLSQTTPVNVTMTEQAAQLEAVTVSAAAAGALIAPSRRGTQTTINDTLIRKLPTLNRNFTDFVQITPQVSTSGPGLSGGGVNNRYNNIQIDGATEKDLFGLGSTGQPGGQAGGKSIGIESVKEYQVLLAPYDVRVGNFAGISVNAVTKSGTNDVNGSVYTYWRNRSMERDQPYLTAFKQLQYGAAVGGPILKDKVFFFVNPEWQTQGRPSAGPALGSSDSRVTQAQLDQFTAGLTSRGLTNIGDASRTSNENPLTNFFGRLDFALPWNSTLVVRDNYAHAEQQVFSRGTTGAQPLYPLTSYLYQFTSEKNAPVAQLRTNFANGGYNELIAAYTRIRDKRATPGSLQTSVNVLIPNVAQLQAGTENSSQANQLDQDIAELTDNYTLPIGSSHRLTIGGQAQWYKVRNLFGQNVAGNWTFGTLDSLTAGAPRQYQVSLPVCPDGTIGGVGCDGAVRFRAGQFAAYVQDDWTATPNFNMSFGLRMDNPVFFTKPPTNQTVLTTFGINTADVPTSNMQFSPRVGFNWNVTGDNRNQVRGGLGLFQSSPAYVWLSNSFQNSGGVSGFASLNCSTNAAAPIFNAANITSAPQQCRTNVTAAAGAEVDYANPNTKFPQVMRGNLAYDRDLGHGVIGTFEGLYTKAINSLFYYNLALQDSPIGTGVDGRAIYGLQPGAPSLKVTGRNAVYDVINKSQDYSYSLTGQLQKHFTSNFGGSIAYTYTQAYSIQDLTSSTASSQYRFGRVYSGSQLDTPLNHSSFETPNRIVSGLNYTLPSKTSLAVIYSGQSGIRYAFTSSNDLNGDNQTANDPIYVPTSRTDPKGPIFATNFTGSNGTVYTPDQQAAAFDSFISSHDCLNDQRGSIMKRNTCFTPWTNNFDVSIEQGITTLRGQNLSLRLDVFNFGNLLNKNWGRQITTGNFNPVQIYTASGLALPGGSTTGTTLANAVPRVTFDPNFNPFNYDNVFSNYSLQLSFRYSF